MPKNSIRNFSEGITLDVTFPASFAPSMFELFWWSGHGYTMELHFLHQQGKKIRLGNSGSPIHMHGTTTPQAQKQPLQSILADHLHFLGLLKRQFLAMAMPRTI